MGAPLERVVPEEPEETPSTRISVIIVSYNCEAALRRTLRSLQDPEKPETAEILVADNGSADASSHMDDEFPQVTVLRLPKNFGRTKARNIAARTAKGTYLLLLEPGVELYPCDLLGLEAVLEQSPQAVAASPLLTEPDGTILTGVGSLPSLDELYEAWKRGQDWFDSLPRFVPDATADPVRVQCVTPGALLVRSAFVRGMNYFDERYGDWGAELDLFTRIQDARRQLLLVPTIRAVWNRSEGLWRPQSVAARALISADRASGILRWAHKNAGFLTAFKLRLRMAGWSFASLLGFSEPSYYSALLGHLLSGRRIDGTQVEL